MIVVDNTVLADFVIGDARVKRSAEQLAFEDPEWISVGLWRHEFGNVLWKILRTTDELRDASEIAVIAFEDAEVALMETAEVLDFPGIFSIALESDLTFYDASYVWLARERGLKLRTRDKGILRKCPDVAVAMPS